MTRPRAPPEDEAAASKPPAPLMEHLIELRKRLIYRDCRVRRLLCRLLRFLQPDLCVSDRAAGAGARRPANNHLIYTALYEMFFTQVKIGMFGGLCLGFPVIAAQIWMFVAPGLYRHERAPSCRSCCGRRCCSSWAPPSSIM